MNGTNGRICQESSDPFTLETRRDRSLELEGDPLCIREKLVIVFADQFLSLLTDIGNQLIIDVLHRYVVGTFFQHRYGVMSLSCTSLRVSSQHPVSDMGGATFHPVLDTPSSITS